VGHAPAELALNREVLAPVALANALRMMSSMPVYVGALKRRLVLTADCRGVSTCLDYQGRRFSDDLLARRLRGATISDVLR